MKPMTMSSSFVQAGYEIHRGVLDQHQLDDLRMEAAAVATAAGSTCVRHLRARSNKFDALSFSDTLLSLLPDSMRPVRSILFDKTETDNWPVLWHQDLTIAVTEEKSISGYEPWSHKEGSPHVQPPASLLANMITIRLHLDETPASNGALRVIPESHLHGRMNSDEVHAYDRSGAITCECDAGDALLMSPLILHSSRRSEQPMRRRVIHFEYAREGDLDAALDWFEPAGQSLK